MKPLKPADWETEPRVEGSRLARAFSPSNIALAKYWGKRDVALNLPANTSVSITLAELGSYTTVEFHSSFKRDRLILNGIEEPSERLERAGRVLSELRELAGVREFARVQSRNNFPTAAGLASSASGLSALTIAARAALGLDLSPARLSEFARKGSGSACRSVFGGFVEWRRGEKPDGSDSVAQQLQPAGRWDLAVLIAVANQAKKTKASTGGMELTRQTSPYFGAWVENAERQAAGIRSAILEKNFRQLAELSESNCIRMHASAMAAQPPVIYWEPATLELIQRIRALREQQGVPVFFTIDAGPNVVAVCEPTVVDRVEQELRSVLGINVLRDGIGEGGRVL